LNCFYVYLSEYVKGQETFVFVCFSGVDFDAEHSN